MESCILLKLKSKYTFEQIFSYIFHKQKLKLIVYSKLLQKKLGICLINFQEQYFINLNVDKYLSTYDFCTDNLISDKNILNKNLDVDLIKYKDKLNINIIKSILLRILNISDEYLIKQGDYKIIDIYSPFFDFLSGLDLFGKYLALRMPIKLIQEQKMSQDYISTFNKLNNDDLNYPGLIFDLDNDNQISKISKYNINFNKLKRLEICSINSINCDKLFNIIFSNGLKNLMILEIKLNEKAQIKSNIFENLNNSIFIQRLKLENLEFDIIYTINIKNLKYLYLDGCKNISLTRNENLEKLKIINTHLSESKSVCKFPNIKYCRFSNITKEQNFCPIIDFSSSKNLEYLEGNMEDFINLENTLLTNAKLQISDNQKIAIESLIKIKTLKIINLELFLFYFNHEELKEIKEDIINTSANELNLKLLNTAAFLPNNNNKCLINEFQKRFINVSKIVIENIIKRVGAFYKRGETNIEIEENTNCNITDFSLTVQQMTIPFIKFNCCKFENLINLSLSFSIIIDNLENSFPIFNDKCKIIFKSLKSFYLMCNSTKNYEFNIINNLYNNMECMPTLTKFELIFQVKVEEKFHQNFICKLLSMDLDYLNFKVSQVLYYSNDYYSKDELKQLFPNIDYNKYKKIQIYKYIKKDNDED